MIKTLSLLAGWLLKKMYHLIWNDKIREGFPGSVGNYFIKTCFFHFESCIDYLTESVTYKQGHED